MVLPIKMTDSSDPDVQEILAVHKAWFDSNEDLVVEKMTPNFADPGYYQFNLNGHTYTSLHEKATLWDNLHAVGVSLANMTIVQEPLVYVEGNLAYLLAVWGCDVTVEDETKVPDDIGRWRGLDTPATFRVTEVYRKDDGRGNPVWKIWHFHASPIADPTSSRLA